MTHKDDLLRAAEILVEYSLDDFEKEGLETLAARLREAAETHVCVPKEPTEAMVNAASNVLRNIDVQFIYRAMLAAAPGGKDE